MISVVIPLYNKEKNRKQSTQVGYSRTRGFLYRVAVYEEHHL